MWNLLPCVPSTGSRPAGRTEHSEAARSAPGALPPVTSVRPVISWGWWEGLGFHFCAFQKTHMRAPQRAHLSLHGFILRPTAGRLCETAVSAERGSCAFEEGTGACGCKPGRAPCTQPAPDRPRLPPLRGWTPPASAEATTEPGAARDLIPAFASDFRDQDVLIAHQGWTLPRNPWDSQEENLTLPWWSFREEKQIKQINKQNQMKASQ